MTWLLATLLLVNILALATSGLVIYLLWSHLQALQHLQRSLRLFDHPEHLAQPLPEPGISSIASDRELAEKEQQLIRESTQRTPIPSRRSSRKRMG